MLIDKVYLPQEEVSDIGLHEVDMRRLGRYVAIAGKNGSGKSRLLARLDQKISYRLNQYLNLKMYQDQVKNQQQYLKSVPDAPDRKQVEKSMGEAQKQIDQVLYRVISRSDAAFKAVRFVPKNLSHQDPRGLPSQSIIANSANTKSPGIDHVAQTYFPYIQNMQNRWWGTGNSHSSLSAEQKIEIQGEYEKLNGLIEAFLGVRLDRSADDEATIFKKPLAEARLSDGQQIMLQLAVAIHAQNANLDNTVFILDELENHLHPAAAIEVLERIDECAPNAQIWIATHSIPLLAYVLSKDPMALWYMENGKITHAGRQPELVLSSLLGDEERIGQLHAFTGLPAQLAANNFAAESLVSPKTLSAEQTDPQISQIYKVISKKYADEKISILDFGCGKGRLLEGLAEAAQLQNIADKADYFAFDPSSTDKSTCLAVIGDNYENSVDRYFNSESSFFQKKDDGSIDVVVMCNVFHEIPPRSWLSLFSETSLIGRSLRADGFLLLVEDQRIPSGEKAHEHGFLVFDTEHLKTLFGITEADIKTGKFISDDYKSDGRLKAHLIEKSLLAGITAQSRCRAVEELRESAIGNIAQLRGAKASYRTGTLHGFWTQQLANAFMFLHEHST